MVCGVWRVRAGCVRAGGMCACACACVRVRARACVCVCVAGGGGPGCVCARAGCRRGVCAGMRVVCRVFLWVVRAETEAESRSQAKDDAVGVWYGHGVCVWGGVGAVLRVVRVVCVVGGQRQIESGKGSRAWMDIPHHLLVFSELVQHL